MFTYNCVCLSVCLSVNGPLQHTHTQQPQCSTQLQMLLQYVVHRFPVGGSEETLKTELWVEPQHGIVCEAPPGLYHLKGVQHSDISEKVRPIRQRLGMRLDVMDFP